MLNPVLKALSELESDSPVITEIRKHIVLKENEASIRHNKETNQASNKMDMIDNPRTCTGLLT